MNILHSRIKPARLLFNAEGKESAAGSLEAGKMGLGGSFSQMIASMTDSQTPPSKTTDDASKESKVTESKEADAGKQGDKGGDKSGDGKGDTLGDIVPGDDLTTALTPPKVDDDKAAAAKAAEPPVEKEKAPKSAKDWETLKQKHAAEVAERETKLTTLQKESERVANDYKEQLAKLQKERDELHAIVEKVAVERSPAYQQKFVQARADLIDRAAQMVTDAGGNAEAFKSAIQLTGQARKDALAEAMGEMDDFDKAQVAQLTAQLSQIDREKADYVAKSKERLAEDEMQQTVQQQEQSAKIIEARKTRFHEVVPTMVRLLPEDHPLAKETNPVIEQAIKDAEDFLFTASDFDQFARASIANSMLPIMTERLTQAGAKIRELQAQIKELTAADPSLGNGGAGGDKAEEPKSFAERFVRAGEKLGSAA